MKLKPPIKKTSQEVMELLQTNRDILEKYHVKKIGLFGSYVRGEQKKGSDLDLLVEFDLTAFGRNFEGYFDNYRELQTSLEKIFGCSVDLLTEDMISPYIKPYVLKEVKLLETG